MQSHDSASAALPSTEMDLSFLSKATEASVISPRTTSTLTPLPGSEALLEPAISISFPGSQMAETMDIQYVAEIPGFAEGGTELFSGLDVGYTETPVSCRFVQDMERTPAVAGNSCHVHSKELQVLLISQNQQEFQSVISHQSQTKAQQPLATPQSPPSKKVNQQHPQVVDEYTQNILSGKLDGHAQSSLDVKESRSGSQTRLCDGSSLIKRRKYVRSREKKRCKQKGDSKVTCDHPGCGKAYTNHSNMKRHYGEKHGSRKRHYCSEIIGVNTKCASSFAERCKLRKHIAMVHEKRRPYPCTVCHHPFAQKSDLKRHYRVVHLRLKHMCARCGKVVSRKAYLTKAHNRCPAGCEVTEVQVS